MSGERRHIAVIGDSANPNAIHNIYGWLQMARMNGDVGESVMNVRNNGRVDVDHLPEVFGDASEVLSKVVKEWSAAHGGHFPRVVLTDISDHPEYAAKVGIASERVGSSWPGYEVKNV